MSRDLSDVIQGYFEAQTATDRAAAEMESRAQANDADGDDLCDSCGHSRSMHVTPFGTSQPCDEEVPMTDDETATCPDLCSCKEFKDPPTPFYERLEGDQ